MRAVSTFSTSTIPTHASTKCRAAGAPIRAWKITRPTKRLGTGARDYCAALGKRLPTEAEREFAARGPQARVYAWGDAAPDATRARYGIGWTKTAPVGSFPHGATPEGVLDLAGNVHEWTASIMRPYPYQADDGREESDALADRVVRGGAADTGPEPLRASWRGASVSRGARAGHHNIGFRCVKDAD
jgi:formylglycine-generating enzyme required for sulfatase activity